MRARVLLALRCGGRAALVVLLLQATAAVALAAALPEVGHVHAPGTPDHPHALLEVGGVGVPALVAPPPPRPAAARRPRARVRRLPGRPARGARTRLGRDPPVMGRTSPRTAASG